MINFTGYHDCPCRDCFEIAIGGVIDRDGVEDEMTPARCDACEEAGCDADGESGCCVQHEVSPFCASCGSTTCGDNCERAAAKE